jgi:hypothetical protein
MWQRPRTLGETSSVRDEYITALEAADNGDYGPLVELHRRFIPMPHRPLLVQQQDNPAMRQPGQVITARTMLPPDAPPPRPVIVQQPDDPSILEPGKVIYRAGRPPLPPADE